MSAARSMKILLVEDDPGDVFLLREFLTELAFEVQLDVAENGLQAMAYLHRQAPYADAPRPDLVLLDLNMPKMDGRQVLKAIREDEAICYLPVLILTTSRADFDINTCYELGGNAYLQKPTGLDSMMELVQKIGYFWGELARLPSEPPESQDA